MSNTTQERKRVSLWQLAKTCFYIGVTGYGGPAIVGNMKQVFVDKKRWVTEEDFITGLSLSQLLPSATGANTIEYLGYKTNGALGAIIAPLCFITPATILITILSAIYFRMGNLPVTRELFQGLGAVVVALIINAIVDLGRSAIKDMWAAGIAVTAFLLVQFLHSSVLTVALAGGALGFLIYRKTEGADSSDYTPVADNPQKATPSFWIAASCILIAIAVAAIITYHTKITDLFLSILRVGALTFGGGFMSIPLFQHEAVNVHHWLTVREFLDGLALGQITPGPVLITAVFIGYKVMGIGGALLGAFTIFSPGVVGMFVLAHQHERVRHLTWLAASIKGIVAAFMGVLLTVIIRLGIHSLNSWKTIAMAVAALLVLLIAKKDPLWVILGGAAVSLLLLR